MNPDAPYDKIADRWSVCRDRSPINPCIADFAARLPEGAYVLDVGCGTGSPVAAYLCGRGFRVTGLDPSPRMLEKAIGLDLPNAEFILGGLFDFRTRRQFDAVIAFDSLWHIAHDDQKKIYPAIAALLKKGGLFLFTHGNRDGEVTGEMFGERFRYSALDADEVCSLLEENGFEVLLRREKFKEAITGERDLLIVTRKTR